MRKHIFFAVFLFFGVWGVLFAQQSINSPNSLKSLTSFEESGNLIIKLEGSEPIENYTYYDYPPDKFIVDIPDVDASKIPKKLEINSMGVDFVKVEPISISSEKPLIQLEIKKSSLSKCLVSAEGNNLFIKIVSPQIEQKETVVESTSISEDGIKPSEKDTLKVDSAETKKSATTIKEISLLKEGKGILIKTDGDCSYKYFTLVNPSRFVVDLKGVYKNLSSPVIEGLGSIEKVRANLFSNEPPVMRVVLDLRENVKFYVVKTSEGLVVTTEEKELVSNTNESEKQEVIKDKENRLEEANKIKDDELARIQFDKNTQLENVTVELKPLYEEETKEYKGYEELFVSQNTSASSESKSAPPPVVPLSFKEKTISGEGKLYTGQPISLSLKDADIKDVLRLFHDISKLNIVVHPSVMGKVTIELENVPWDQAMDIVLKNLGLDYIYENNVIWVASSAEISRKFSEKQRLEEDKLNAETPVVFTKRMSYAKADQMKSVIDKFLTNKGEIYTDKRTNTVIIKEVPSRKEGILKLLETLDAPTPQVMIEARIVESTVSWRSQFGISWGGGSGGTQNNLPNNTTGFPNWFTGDFAVNVPPPASNGYIDLVFGNLAGTFNLDVRLSALENTGRGRVISAPRIVTQDNEKASIESGRQIPVPIATADKVSVMYVNATLKLDVTPHITADGHVNMDVDITNDAVDFQNQQPNTPPPIFKKQAKTTLKVRDGQTAVIGGIFVTSEGISQQGLPFFSKIPVLGWLFKNRIKNRDNSELLIFLTPKIIR